ncbi:AAA family ATPase (plasmid) [Brevibacillus laterosporus]|nr:ATP-binding protein [Brevibacillus laterosporus]TPG93537.1 AAA family ATPase [Brevibacillus laterosporus]
MQNLFQQIAQSSTEKLGSSERKCSICRKTLSPVEINILGVNRMVAVACKCETDLLAKEERQRAKVEFIQKIQAYSDDDQMVPNASLDQARHPGIHEAYVKLKDFAENLEGWKDKGLYIFGPNGTGKSSLLSAVAIKLRQQGISVIYTTTSSLINRTSNKYTKLETLAAYKNAEVLIIDEIGADIPAHWEMSDLFEVLESRQDRIPTLYGSNLSVLELEKKYNERNKDWGTRLMERVLGGCDVVEVTGSSERFDKYKKTKQWADRQVNNHV